MQCNSPTPQWIQHAFSVPTLGISWCPLGSSADLGRAHFQVWDSAGHGLAVHWPLLLHAPVLLLLLGPVGQARLDLLTAMDDRRASEQIPKHKPISSHYYVRSTQHIISWIWWHDGSCCLRSWQVILPWSGEHAWWHMWQRPWLQGEMVGGSFGDIFVAYSTLRHWHN